MSIKSKRSHHSNGCRLTFFLCCFFFSQLAFAQIRLENADVRIWLSDASVPQILRGHALPYHWDRLHPGHDGQAEFTIPFEFKNIAPSSADLAIFIPRVGNTFSVQVNQKLLMRMGHAGSLDEDFANQPQFILIPSSLLREHNELVIRIAVQAGHNGGLSIPIIGPVALLQPQYESRYLWQVNGALMVTVMSAVLGAIAFLIWLRQRESMFLVYALAETFWVIYVSPPLFEQTPIPWPWWGFIYFCAYAMSGMLIFKFVLMVMQIHTKRIRWVTNSFIFFTPLIVGIGVFGGVPTMEPFWVSTGDCIGIAMVTMVVLKAWRSKQVEHGLIALGALILVFIGFRDFIFQVILPYSGALPEYRQYFGNIGWSRYAWPIFGVLLSWVVADRSHLSELVKSGWRDEFSRRSLLQEAKLAEHYAQDTKLQREQAIQEERQRVVRDMHDGLGSQLMTALQLAQNPSNSQDEVRQQLDEALRQLKLTVDATQESYLDIGTLLGSLRYRLQTRLTAAKISLNWQVDELPQMPHWTVSMAHDLQLILFEAFSNLIVHSHASVASLSARYDAPANKINILLRDNGCGFSKPNGSGDSGHGLNNMQLRAQRIGAALSLESDAEGSLICLSFSGVV